MGGAMCPFSSSHQQQRLTVVAGMVTALRRTPRVLMPIILPSALTAGPQKIEIDLNIEPYVLVYLAASQGSPAPLSPPTIPALATRFPRQLRPSARTRSASLKPDHRQRRQRKAPLICQLRMRRSVDGLRLQPWPRQIFPAEEHA